MAISRTGFQERGHRYGRLSHDKASLGRDRSERMWHWDRHRYRQERQELRDVALEWTGV